MSLVSIVEPQQGIYLLLDSNQPGVVRGSQGGISRLTFLLGSLSSPTEGIRKFSIRSMVFGNSTYNIVDDSANGGLKNNLFFVDGNPIIVPPGTYSAENFSTTVQALIVAAIGAGVTVSYNPITLKITITTPAPVTIIFGSDSPAYEMGFTETTYGPGVSFTSDYVVDFGGPAAVLISVKEIGSYNMVMYNNFPCNFIYPLTGATPSISQGNPITLSKLDCWVSQRGQLSQLTVELFFIRNGVVWPLINDVNSFYEILLQIV